jgi:Cu(I)/Ag(I) efflux system membrane fusion protein
MKTKNDFIIVVLLAGLGGWSAANWFSAVPEISPDSARAAENMPAAYQCPMHPWVKSETPGSCTICGMRLVTVAAYAENYSSTARPPSDEMPTGFSVQTAEVKMQLLRRTVRVAGMISEDETRHGIVCAPVEGRIDGLAMNCDGEQIHQRQPIANIFSRTLLAAAEEYKIALKSGGANLISARQKLEQCGLLDEQIATIPARQPDDIHFGLVSQQDGTIVKSYVSEGQYVKEGEKLFETADFTKMWFMFNADEKDLPLIHKGEWVNVRTASLPGETLRAKVAFVSPNFDETTRTAPVRVVLENPDGRIKNKIYAEAEVETDAGDVLAVPRSAVLWLGNTPRVYVETAPGNYSPRSVCLGRAGDENWEVITGLKAGEKVVTTGNLLIDAQTQLAAMTGDR